MTFAKRLAPVLIMVLLAELAARVWVGAVDPDHVVWYDASVQVRVEALEAGVEPDVVFVGTSMAWQGFVPAVFSEIDPDNRTAYNLGIDGGVPQVVRPWLIDEVLARADPDVVVWGLSSLDLSPSFGEPARDRYNAAFQTRPGFVGSVDRAAASISAIVRWRRVLRDPASWNSSQDRDDLAAARTTVGSGGERRDFEPNKIEQRLQILQSRLADQAADVRDIDAFDDTVAELQSRDIEIIVVLLPVPPTFVDAHPGGRADFEARLAFLQNMAVKSDIRVIDLSTDFGEADFVDFTHLSESAARDFTTKFTTALSETSDNSNADCTIVMVEDEFGFVVPEEQC